MTDRDLDLSLARPQLKSGVLAGVAAYVVGFLAMFLPGPIANPGVFPPDDVVNATINTSRRPELADSTFPLSETIDPVSSAGGLFYNAHLVDLVLSSRGVESTLAIRSNVLLAEQTNTTTGFGAAGRVEIVLAGLPIPPVLLFGVPILLLAVGGYLVNDRSRESIPTPETAAASGATVALGYLPLVIVGASLIRFRNSRILFGHIDLVHAILLAGIIYPVAFGGLGGYVWHTRKRWADASTEGTETGRPAGARGEGSTGRPLAETARTTGASGTARGRIVMTDELAFEPGTVTVSPGDTVVWENTGNLTFTVTAYEEGIPDGAGYFASGGFDNEQAARDAWANSIDGGGVVKPGETYEHTFEVPGDYYYVCIPHEAAGMTGTVVVE